MEGGYENEKKVGKVADSRIYRCIGSVLGGDFTRKYYSLEKSDWFFDRGTGIAYVPIKNEAFRMDSSDCGIRAFIPGTSESAAGK